jgi:hypothetical protein
MVDSVNESLGFEFAKKTIVPNYLFLPDSLDIFPLLWVKCYFLLTYIVLLLKLEQAD